MNKLVTRGGKAKLSKWGVLELTRNPAAINAPTVGIVTVGEESVSIDIPDLDPAWAAIRLVWKARDSDGNLLRHRVDVPLVEGVQGLGSPSEVQGVTVGLEPDYELQVVDASGNIGYSGGITLTDLNPTPVTVPTVSNVLIAGTGHTGDNHSVSFTTTGNPSPTITYAWQIDGGATLSTSSTYSPSAAGSLTCTVTATNSEGADSQSSPGFAVVTLAAPVVSSVSISGSGTTGTLHAASYALAVAGNPAPTITYSWELGGVAISGATASTYTPPSAGDLTVVVAATNSQGSSSLESSVKTITTTPSNVAPDITAASITGTTAAGSVHGLSITAIGTPAPSYTYQWKLDGAIVLGATAATYTSPADSTKTLTCTITATNVAGSDSFTTAGIVLVPVTPAQLAPAEWDFQTSNPSLGVTQLDTVRIKAVRGAVFAQWTNTAAPTDAEADAAGDFEDMVLLSTSGEWQTWGVPDLIVGSRNFRRYNPTVWAGDKTRAGRLSIRIKTASGIWSLRSSVKAINLASTVLINGDWIPLHHRTQTQYIGDGTVDLPKPGPAGGGYQFQRSWGNSAADPDYVFAIQDISIPQHSKDFGGWWEHPPLNGLKNGNSGQSVAIDSGDAKRILLAYSAGHTRNPEGNPNGWDDLTGLHLSTDQGATFTLVKNVIGLGGSASNDPGETDVRYMQHCLFQVPGGTPTTREWWWVAHVMFKGATTKHSLVFKSTDGGATWSDTLATLDAATYGLPLVLKRQAGSGAWYLGTSKGLFYTATNPAGTWTNLTTGTNLGAGYCYDVDVAGAGTEVWAAIGPSKGGSYVSADHGVWKTTTGGTGATSWSKVTNYNIRAMCISPHDRLKVLIAGNNGILPKRTIDGGTTWTNITDSGNSTNPAMNKQMPGQPESFEHRIQDTHAYFIWHKTDPNKVLAARYQHHGWSTDAGATWTWRSANFDYNHVHAFTCHPQDYTKVLMAVQDRVTMYTDNGHKWVEDDGADSDKKDEIALSLGATAGTHLGAGRGALILYNPTNSRTAMFSALGDKPNTRNRKIFRLTSGTVGGRTTSTGTITLITSQYNSYCNYGMLDPTNNARGYLGRTRLVLNADDSVTEGDMGKECVGIDSAGNVYAIDKNAEASGGTVVYKTTNPTATPPTWSAVVTLSQQARPFDTDPRAISYDPTSSVGKLLIGCTSRFVLVEDGVDRTVATVSDLATGTWPTNQPYSCALDPFNSDVAYISIHRTGGPVVFKTVNLSATTPTWTDITGNFLSKCQNKLFIHPKTGDLIASHHSGTFMYPAHTKQTGASYYDDAWAIVSKYQL